MHKKRARRTDKRVSIDGICGMCGGHEVFLGFAPASTLYAVSFADVLDEATNKGYQRKFSPRHSLEFRDYIGRSGSTTIPLTFNLRPESASLWTLERRPRGLARLTLSLEGRQQLAQVDCQHRLGYLEHASVPLAFMTFIGLSVRDEMKVFNVINGKAKGLDPSLLDYHEIQLAENLEKEQPELLIAFLLRTEEHSPWFGRLRLGGKPNPTVGMKRRASLRTMREAVKRFLRATKVLDVRDAASVGRILIAYWQAVALVLKTPWEEHRKHFLTKGIGVYSLMSLAADFYREAAAQRVEPDFRFFVAELSEFAREFDWSNHGPLKGLGGVSGADRAYELLKKARVRARMRVVRRAQ